MAANTGVLLERSFLISSNGFACSLSRASVNRRHLRTLRQLFLLPPSFQHTGYSSVTLLRLSLRIYSDSTVMAELMYFPTQSIKRGETENSSHPQNSHGLLGKFRSRANDILQYTEKALRVSVILSEAFPSDQ